MNKGADVLDAPAIKRRDTELGLDACGITHAEPSQRAAFYREWAAAGGAGEMQWMAREPERRTDPRAVLLGACSLIVAGLNYWQESSPRARRRRSTSTPAPCWRNRWRSARASAGRAKAPC
jgi:epoxyqueuosine reductase QueG